MIRKTLFLVSALSLFVLPLVASGFSQCIESEEMWWCSVCGLAYPASQKICLNKDCPLFRKGR